MEYILALVLQTALSAIICLAAAPIGNALGIMDKPDSLRKLHRGAVPLVGGLAILLPATLIGGALSYVDGVGMHWVIVPVLVTLFVMGMIDDRAHLPPVVRLSVSLVMFSFAIILAPQLALTSLDFGGGVSVDVPPFMGAMLTIVSLVGFQYAFNMSDGANGVASGMAMIWAVFFALAGTGTLSMLALLIVAGGAVFLMFNMRGRIFLGDSGAYGISAVMGLLGLAITSHADSSLTNMQLMGLFLLPVLDCLRLIGTRLRAGRAPFSPDREHLHHYLLRWLVAPSRTAIAYWSMVALPNAVGYVVGGMSGFMATVALTLIMYGFVIAKTAAVAKLVGGEAR